MSFYNIEQLAWLFILPFFLFIYIAQIRIREARLQKWLGQRRHFLKSLISENKRHFKLALRLLVVVFFLIALARPQMAGEEIDLERSGVHILLLVDVSQSMLAEDVKPNRLFFMQKELGRFLDMSEGDEVALVAFANSSALISPFTPDTAVVKSYLADLSPNYFSSQGTNFGRAFDFVRKTFQSIKVKKNESITKVLVVASDGEDHSKSSRKKIKELLDENVRVFTLSFGTKDGGAVPIKDFRDQIKKYKKDPSGKLVVSKLNSKDLKDFAKLGQGAYYHATYGSKVIERLRSDIDKLEQTTFEKASFVSKKEVYHWFLVIALLLAMLEMVLSDRPFFSREKQIV